MNTCTRIFVDRDPDTDFSSYHFHDDPWKARWIYGAMEPDAKGGERELPGAWVFRKNFQCPERETIRIHVTADQRYDLFLDGKLVARGSERGTLNSWFYESYELKLNAGSHQLLARVWWTGTGDLQHFGHSSVRPGFLLHAEGAWEEVLDTRSEVWETARLKGYSFCMPQIWNGFNSVGARTVLDARLHPAALERGAGTGWEPACDRGEIPAFRASGDEPCSLRYLTPAVLPAMEYARKQLSKVRFAATLQTAEAAQEAISEKASNAALVEAWGRMLQKRISVEIPPHTRQRVLVDLEGYVCGRTQLEVAGGAGARVRLSWAESLYLNKDFREKGNRNEVEGKFFHGMGDEITCNGDRYYFFSPFWWTSGRYLEVLVETEEEALRVDRLEVEETHYPVWWVFDFDCDDKRWRDVLPRTKRVLEMCSHESYMDCPYYEQLMYGGDTRLEILATYATTRDDRLPRKAILLFDRSRSESGLTMSRIPSRVKQVIPTFSLWFVQMVSDYAMWRGDVAFVTARMSGVRSVLSAFWERLGTDGLIHGPHGWNFSDWVEGWHAGIVPNSNYDEAGASLNLQYIWTLRVAADLEETYGEKGLAAWDRELADRIEKEVVARYWDEARALFAEDASHTMYTEHAQCMAVLGGSVPEGQLEALAEALATAEDLARATVYFRHYLFETWRVLRRPEEIEKRMDLWFGLKDLGLYTVLEMPEPSRSDCHAWGSHPMYHALTSIAGIRPGDVGFTTVRIEPQPGSLKRIEAMVPHPSGETVLLDIRMTDDGLWHGTVITPPLVASELVLNGQVVAWDGGPMDV